MTLTALRLSPVHIRMIMDVPKAEEAPFFQRVKWKDGTEFHFIADDGAEGYLNESGTAYRQIYH